MHKMKGNGMFRKTKNFGNIYMIKKEFGKQSGKKMEKCGKFNIFSQKIKKLFEFS